MLPLSHHNYQIILKELELRKGYEQFFFRFYDPLASFYLIVLVWDKKTKELKVYPAKINDWTNYLIKLGIQNTRFIKDLEIIIPSESQADGLNYVLFITTVSPRLIKNWIENLGESIEEIDWEQVIDKENQSDLKFLYEFRVDFAKQNTLAKIEYQSNFLTLKIDIDVFYL